MGGGLDKGCVCVCVLQPGVGFFAVGVGRKEGWGGTSGYGTRAGVGGGGGPFSRAEAHGMHGWSDARAQCQCQGMPSHAHHHQGPRKPAGRQVVWATGLVRVCVRRFVRRPLCAHYQWEAVAGCACARACARRVCRDSLLPQGYEAEWTPSTIFVASDHLVHLLVKNFFIRRDKHEDERQEERYVHEMCVHAMLKARRACVGGGGEGGRTVPLAMARGWGAERGSGSGREEGGGREGGSGREHSPWHTQWTRGEGSCKPAGTECARRRQGTRAGIPKQPGRRGLVSTGLRSP